MVQSNTKSIAEDKKTEQRARSKTKTVNRLTHSSMCSPQKPHTAFAASIRTVLISLAIEQLPHDASEVRIVGLVIESERSYVVEIRGELGRILTTQHLHGCAHLLLADL